MTESSTKTLNPEVARVLKRLHYPLDVILTCVRWYRDKTRQPHTNLRSIIQPALRRKP
jgi:hypothetical protein